MKKYSKYLISLFLVFGLMVNDCSLYSQSNSDEYYQFSNIIHRIGSDKRGYKLYTFGQINSSAKPSFQIFLAYHSAQEVYSFQIQLLLKTQTLLYQEVKSITSQYVFVNEMITSKDLYKSLYIA